MEGSQSRSRCKINLKTGIQNSTVIAKEEHQKCLGGTLVDVGAKLMLCQRKKRMHCCALRFIIILNRALSYQSRARKLHFYLKGKGSSTYNSIFHWKMKLIEKDNGLQLFHVKNFPECSFSDVKAVFCNFC